MAALWVLQQITALYTQLMHSLGHTAKLPRPGIEPGRRGKGVPSPRTSQQVGHLTDPHTELTALKLDNQNLLTDTAARVSRGTASVTSFLMG